MQSSVSKWLRPCPARPDAQIQLFCFTYAGGSGSEYLQWHKMEIVPQWLEIIAVMMPGRSTRFGDEQINKMDVLVQQIADALVQTGRVAAGGKPYAFYGHSMGTYIGLEVMRDLRRRGLPLPITFFAAASSEPSVRHRRPPIASMSNDDIKKMLKSMGGTPDEVLESDEMMEAIVYPVVRADWGALDTYEIQPEDPLEVKIVAVRGRDDHLATEEQQRAWSTHAKSSFELVTLPGGHFFLKTATTELLELIVNRIQSLIAC